jgi:hypothetical protein
MLCTPKLEEMVGKLTYPVTPNVVTNSSKTIPWSVEFSLPLIDRPYGNIWAQVDGEVYVHPYYDGEYKFSFPKPQPNIPKFKVQLSDVRIVNQDDDVQNFKTRSDYELNITIVLHNGDPETKFARSSWTLKTFQEKIVFEREWKGITGIKDSPNMMQTWSEEGIDAEIFRDLYTEVPCTDDVPREFTMLMVESEASGFTQMTIELSVLDFGGNVVISPVYSKPLEF